MHAPLRETLDSSGIGERLEEADQQLPIAEMLDLLGGGLAYLGDALRVPNGTREVGTGLRVGLVGKRCRDAGTALDHHIEAASGQA